MQTRHGANERHRHRQRGDDGGTPVLQKQIHHDEHQHHGLSQRLEHFANGLGHKRRGVVGRGVGQAFGEFGFEFLQHFFYCCARVQRVGTSLQKHAHWHCGVAIHTAIKVVVFGAQLYPRHVFEPYYGAFFACAHHNVGKGFWFEQAALGGHGKGEFFGVVGR